MDNKHLIQYISVGLIILSFGYGFFCKKNIKGILVFLLLTIYLYLIDYKYVFNFSMKSKTDTLKNIENSELFTNIIGYTNNLVLSDLYKINQIPKNFVYIKNEKTLLSIIYELKYLVNFDKDAYYKIIVLLEYFYKYYYNMIIDVYDVEDYFPIIKSIRIEILNLLYSFVYTVPQSLPNHFKIDDVDNHIKKRIKIIQGITRKKLQTIANKLHLDKNSYDPPTASNYTNKCYAL